MQARLVEFGEIEVEKQRYEYDVVIEAGKVRKRKKGPSKRYRGQAGHTPLSIEEKIPWGGNQLIVGTGTYGRLPVMPEVQEEARRRGIKLVVVPTEEACQLLSDLQSKDALRDSPHHLLRCAKATMMRGTTRKVCGGACAKRLWILPGT